MEPTSPFPGGDPTRTALKLDLDAKRREAQEKWAAFEEVRKPIIESGKTPGREATARLDEFHQRYKFASAAAQAAEDDFFAFLEKSDTKIFGPKPLTSITDAVLKQVGGIEGMKAVGSPGTELEFAL